MAIKTIELTGAIAAVNGLDGSNAHIRNDGESVVFAAKKSDITEAADGVLSIPAGASATLTGISGRLFLLGNGSVQIVSNDYAESPFKSAVAAGSATDGSNRAAGSSGLLINPDFRINQRSLSEYTSGYTVDRWSLDPNKASVSVGTDGVRVTAANDITSNTHVFWQRLEFPLPPGKYTLSVNVKEVTGLWSARIRTVTADGTYAGSYYVPAFSTGVNKVSVDLPENEYISAVSVGVSNGTEAGDSVKLEWIKLEPGSGATTFLPPDYTTALAKCQRYYQIRTTNDIDPLDLRPSMRTITDISQVTGGYAYIAEL